MISCWLGSEAVSSLFQSELTLHSLRVRFLSLQKVVSVSHFINIILIKRGWGGFLRLWKRFTDWHPTNLTFTLLVYLHTDAGIVISETCTNNRIYAEAWTIMGKKSGWNKRMWLLISIPKQISYREKTVYWKSVLLSPPWYAKIRSVRFPCAQLTHTNLT
jgi:hypothetical protein